MNDPAATTTPAETVDELDRRGLFILLAVSTLTVMAGATISPSLPDLGRHFEDGSPLGVRLVLTLPGLFTALGAPLMGWLVDRYGRKPPLLASLALYGLAGAGGGLAPSLPALWVSRAGLGLAVAGTMTAATTLIADFYRGRDRAKILGRQASFMALGGVCFLTLGGWLADLSWRAPFGIYLIALLLLPAAVRWLHEPPSTRMSPGGEVGDEATSDGMPWGLAALLFALAFAGMTIFYMIPVQVPFRVEALGVHSAVWTGVAIAASTAFSALASLQYGRVRERLGYRGTLGLVFTLMAIANLGIALAPSYPWLLASLAVNGCGVGMLLPNLNNWAGDRAPEALRGRILGGVTTAFFLGQFVSPLWSQPIADAHGLAAAFETASGVTALLAVTFWAVRIARTHRRSSAAS